MKIYLWMIKVYHQSITVAFVQLQSDFSRLQVMDQGCFSRNWRVLLQSYVGHHIPNFMCIAAPNPLCKKQALNVIFASVSWTWTLQLFRRKSQIVSRDMLLRSICNVLCSIRSDQLPLSRPQRRTALKEAVRRQQNLWPKAIGGHLLVLLEQPFLICVGTNWGRLSWNTRGKIGRWQCWEFQSQRTQKGLD